MALPDATRHYNAPRSESAAMALVITVAQQKGGAGKTMLAANLAALWAATRRVALLDIDPQNSLGRWYALRGQTPGLAPLVFSALSGWRLRGELDRLRAGADVLIIDTPPHIDTDAMRAIRAASLVLVPLQPSPPDLWAAEGTLKIAAAERRPVALLLNRAPARSALRTEVEADIARAKLTLLPVSLGNRSAYAQAFARGMGVTEARSRASARPGGAAAEFAAAGAAIEELLTQ
jgi:chromosome partitioning protein